MLRSAPLEYLGVNSRVSIARGTPRAVMGYKPILRRLAADVFQQSDQRRRRDARDSGRLAQSGWLVNLQLLPDFVGQTAGRAVVEIRRQDEGFIAAVRGNILPPT